MSDQFGNHIVGFSNLKAQIIGYDDVIPEIKLRGSKMVLLYLHVFCVFFCLPLLYLSLLYFDDAIQMATLLGKS